MARSAKLNAEQQFAATQKKAKIVLAEKEVKQQERAAQVAKLKALRLDKEAADQADAEAEKAATKKK